ncbi:MAG: LysR substrate-binding domain-containing protein [Vicingaceae bacterium]
MNFQQLNYALAVHRYRHFGKAAVNCNVTQATLSGMIKRLEEELSFPLFDRSRHPIMTTEKGLGFMQKAEEILMLQQKLYDLKSEGGDLEGSLKVGIIPTIANTLLPLILPAFLKAHPQLQLSIEEITTEEIVKRLKNRELDAGILSTPLPHSMEMPLEEILYYEALYVYGIEGEANEVSVKELRKERVWLLEEGHCFRNQSMAICGLEQEGKQDAQLNFKSNSFDTLLNLSDQFGGFTLLPELYYRQLGKKRKEKCKTFKRPIPVREISLVSSSPHLKKEALTALARHVQSEVPKRLITAKYANKDLDIISM